jgi:hypothetical protein
MGEDALAASYKITNSVQLQRIRQNRALGVSASERLRAYHDAAASRNAPLKA